MIRSIETEHTLRRGSHGCRAHSTTIAAFNNEALNEICRRLRVVQYKYVPPDAVLLLVGTWDTQRKWL